MLHFFILVSGEYGFVNFEIIKKIIKKGKNLGVGQKY